MSNKQISNLPPELTEIALVYNKRVRSRWIYNVIVLLIAGIAVSLPLIRVTLSVQGRGIIRPETEKAVIKAPQTERVDKVFITEGQWVNQGDTLLIMQQDILAEQMGNLRRELSRSAAILTDLDHLVSGEADMPKTRLIAAHYKTFRQREREIDLRIARAGSELERNRILREQEFIALKTFEDLKFQLDRLKEEKRVLEATTMTEWKVKQEEYRKTVSDLKLQLVELDNRCQLLVLTAPVSGTVEEFRGIYPGSMPQPGQALAVISPASEKIAEIYVPASGIGHLRAGQPVRIQVDAFNYNEWGQVKGSIQSISDDFILMDESPVFLVKCKLYRNYLQLNNGVRGTLKKGMTVNARFVVCRRSLFQLLYQKSDDWLNPSRSMKDRTI